MQNKRTNHIKKAPHLLTAIVGFSIIAAYLLLQMQLAGPRNANAAITLHTTTDIAVNTNSSATSTKTAVGIDAQGNSVVVWDTESHPGDLTGKAVVYRRFAHDESATDASDVLINTSTGADQQKPDVAMDENGNFVVVWQSDHSTSNEIYLQAFKANGTTVGSQTQVNSSTSGNQILPAVSIDYDGPADTERVVVVWQTDASGNKDIAYRRYDIDFEGTAGVTAVDANEVVAHSYTTGDQERPDVSMNNLTEFMVTWNGANTSGSSGSSYRVFAADGTAVVSDTEFDDDNGTHFPKVAADKIPRSSLDDANERRFAIAYTTSIDGNSEIAARRVICTDPNPANASDTDLTCSTDAVEINVATDLTGAQSNPDIDADYLGNFTVTWQDSNIEGNSTSGIGAQSYTYLGKRVGQNFIVNNTIAGSQITPSIGMNTDGFYNITLLSGGEVYMQNYVTEIFKVQTEVLPYASSTGIENDVETDIGPNGNHVEVWKSDDGNIYFTLREFDNEATTIADSVAVDDNPGGNTGCHDSRTTNYVCDNPSVSFFKDASGSNLGKFVIVWERDSTTGDLKDIMYRIYDASGNPEGAAAIINTAVTGYQVEADVSAGIYDSGGAANEKKFAVGWIDQQTNKIEAAFHSTSFTYATLYSSCSSCQTPRVDFNEDNGRAAYSWSSGGDIFTAKTVDGTINGANVEIDSSLGELKSEPDVAFIDNDTYLLAYSYAAGETYGTINGKIIGFNAGGNPTDDGEFLSTQYAHTDGAQSNSKLVADKSNNSALLVWTDFPISSGENHIFGQFYSTITATPVQFGPSFRINSTQENSQSIPAVGMNETGQVVITWEGNVDQPSNIDTAGLGTQLLQNPLNIQSVDPLTQTAQQEITAGARFLSVPGTITFQAVNLSTIDNQTQSVSVRSNVDDNACNAAPCGSNVCDGGVACVGDSCVGDSACICASASCGGDTLKYIEIEDASGVQNFTLSVQSSDFISVQDNVAHIKNNQHFWVKNWDNSNFGTGSCDDPSCAAITAGTCGSDPDTCFLTVQSSQDTTGFSLHSETTNFALVNAQKTLATKDDGGTQEVGKWRIFPEFKITIPPVIPPGNHSATITFTLT